MTEKSTDANDVEHQASVASATVVAAAAEAGLASEDDAAVLAKLGYKQELRRNFGIMEVFGIAFSIMGLLPSIASTLAYSLPAGPAGLVWVAHYFASPSTRNALSFLVGYSNTLGLVGGLCSIDYGFALMFVSVIVIARDGEWEPSNGIVYVVFMCCVLVHGVLASTISKGMAKLQNVFVIANFILITATIIALPIGRASQRNDGAFIFGTTANLTTWTPGFAWFLSWLSPIWTIGGFDSCVHMAEEASNATKAVPYGILLSIGSCWFFGTIICIVIAACISTDIDSVLGSSYGQPMAQIYYDALGKRGALGFMSLLFIVQFLMGLSILVAASRQSWTAKSKSKAFSRDGALPFSNFFRRVSPRLFIPVRAVWGCVMVACILGLLCLIAPAAAAALFSLAVAANNVAWGTPIFCRLVWGQNKFKPGPVYTGDKLSRPIGWLAIIFLVFGITLAMFPATGPNPTPESMNYTVVVNCAVWGGSLLYYFVGE
ncbi:unnamed protein product [Periconia digitata]|uniref:Uncharacterized protein n=1 Tax=Periconia digitata TaxID=1303443 RepID=A0A9W4UKW5_9PLEO|nr:unnamed protein product [Periconia digitata]